MMLFPRVARIQQLSGGSTAQRRNFWMWLNFIFNRYHVTSKLYIFTVVEQQYRCMYVQSLKLLSCSFHKCFTCITSSTAVFFLIRRIELLPIRKKTCWILATLFLLAYLSDQYAFFDALKMYG